jgi:hypothetical protein
MLNTLLDELFGIKIIEPIASYNTVLKVRPTFKREIKPS